MRRLTDRRVHRVRAAAAVRLAMLALEVLVLAVRFGPAATLSLTLAFPAPEASLAP